MSPSQASARAIATRCRIPPDSSAGTRSAESASPTSSNSSSARARRFGRDMPRSSSGASTFRRAERHGNSARSWNTYAIDSGSGPVTCAPSTRTDPPAGRSSPPIARNALDLPHPDGPMRLTSSPARTSNDSPAAACTSPYRRSRSSTTIRGAARSAATPEPDARGSTRSPTFMHRKSVSHSSVELMKIDVKGDPLGLAGGARPRRGRPGGWRRSSGRARRLTRSATSGYLRVAGFGVMELRNGIRLRPLGATPAEFEQDLLSNLYYRRGTTVESASTQDAYDTLALTVRDRLAARRARTAAAQFAANPRWVYYLSAEYLLGRQLEQNLLYSETGELAAAALKTLGLSPAEVEELDVEPGLGNGGLGRLAACLLDAMATLDIPAVGYGIRLGFGLFNPVVRDGAQVGRRDQGAFCGDPWEVPAPPGRPLLWLSRGTAPPA